MKCFICQTDEHATLYPHDTCMFCYENVINNDEFGKVYQNSRVIDLWCRIDGKRVVHFRYDTNTTVILAVPDGLPPGKITNVTYPPGSKISVTPGFTVVLELNHIPPITPDLLERIKQRANIWTTFS